MQAILTKYLCPTDHRGSRVKASCQAGSLVMTWNDELNTEDNHRTAAVALQAQLGWHAAFYGRLVSGCLPDGSYCHVFSGRGV